ncbi:MAG: TRAP transporter small permease [Pikeienuella sp.]
MAGRVLRIIDQVESLAATLAYLIIAGLLIGDVLGRELLGVGIFGAQKMAVFAAIVAGFLGLALATSSNSHLRPTFLDPLLKGQVFDRIGDAMSCVFYLFMAAVAVQFIQLSIEYNDRAAVLYWLLWPIQLVIPYALASTALRHGLFAGWPALKPEKGAGE